MEFVVIFNRTYKKKVKIPLNLPRISFVLVELSFVTMPSSYNCMKMNKIQFCNCLPKLVDCSQEEQYAVETQHVLPQIAVL